MSTEVPRYPPFKVFGNILLSLLTFTYAGAYNFHTAKPIEEIRKHQANKDELIRALIQFRTVKTEELVFVSRAAALSAAAVIGVFSWPTAEKTVWPAKMLWNWSFFLSCFALIGSAHQRLLRHLPGENESCSDKESLLEQAQPVYSEDKLPLALNLFLQPPVSPEARNKERRVSRRMLWIWQCPTMLMSYSWVFFLVGYALHVLNPLFDPSQAEITSKVSIVTLCGCALVALNFGLCAGICQLRLRKGFLVSQA